jgi:hypothetical protein
MRREEVTETNANAPKLLSPLAGLVSAALGGPFAALLLATNNARVLGRRRDAGFLAFAYLVSVVSVLACTLLVVRGSAIGPVTMRQSSGYVLHGLAIVTYGAFYLLQRASLHAAPAVSGARAWALSALLIAGSLFVQIAVTDVAALLLKLAN